MYNCTNGQVVVNEAYSCSANAVCAKRNDVRMCYCSYGFKGNGENCQHMTNCLDWFDAGFTNDDVYTVKPANWNGPAFEVSCSMTGAGGWTVSVTHYKQGIGVKHVEYTSLTFPLLLLLRVTVVKAVDKNI